MGGRCYRPAPAASASRRFRESTLAGPTNGPAGAGRPSSAPPRQQHADGAADLLHFSVWPAVSQAAREGAAPWQTHTVFNQVPPLEGVDVFSSNVPLVEAVAARGRRLGAASGRRRSGAFVGGEPQQQWGRLANENRPVLRTLDRYGNRIDEVEFHPAWHQLMKMGVEHELHSLPWTSEEPSAHTARAALYMTAMQAEAGFACPITMTFAVVPALRAQPELAAEWEPLVTATTL